MSSKWGFWVTMIGLAQRNPLLLQLKIILLFVQFRSINTLELMKFPFLIKKLRSFWVTTLSVTIGYRSQILAEIGMFKESDLGSRL